MSIKLSENLQLLRKEKGITQEELANVLNVTSQSVSKWENNISYPDIELLPEIAKYYEVSIDELLGYVSKNSINSIYIQMKELVESSDIDYYKSDTAYSLARLASSTLWKQEEKEVNRILKGQKLRNLSYGQGDGGLSVSGNNSLFITTFKDYPKFDNSTIRKVYNYLCKLSNLNTLKVLFALFDLMMQTTIRKSYTIEEICKKANLSEEAVYKAMNDLDIYYDKEEFENTNVEKYSLRHVEQVPMLVTMLIPALENYNFSLFD